MFFDQLLFFEKLPFKEIFKVQEVKLEDMPSAPHAFNPMERMVRLYKLANFFHFFSADYRLVLPHERFAFQMTHSFGETVKSVEY